MNFKFSRFNMAGIASALTLILSMNAVAAPVVTPAPKPSAQELVLSNPTMEDMVKNMRRQLRDTQHALNLQVRIAYFEPNLNNNVQTHANEMAHNTLHLNGSDAKLSLSTLAQGASDKTKLFQCQMSNTNTIDCFNKVIASTNDDLYFHSGRLIVNQSNPQRLTIKWEQRPVTLESVLSNTYCGAGLKRKAIMQDENKSLSTIKYRCA